MSTLPVIRRTPLAGGNVIDLVTGGEVAGLVVAVGGCGVVFSKGVRAMRRFARFLDGFLGDGSTKHPSVLERLDKQDKALADLAHGQVIMQQSLDQHIDTDTPSWRAEGEAWGHRIDARLDALELRTTQGNG